MPSFFYAVAKGRKPGIYKTWDECKAQVHQYSNPLFKKFQTYSHAEEFIKQHTVSKVTGREKQFSTSSSNLSVPKTLYVLGKQKSTFTLAETDVDANVPPHKRRKLIRDDKDISQTSTDNVTKDGFIVDENGYTAVYTDGACSKNGMHGAQAGIGVWFGDNHSLNISKPLVGVATNNKAEINAVMCAVNQAKKAGIKKLKIHTDSQFLISCITKWMPKWKRNGWRTGTGSVKNKVELQELEKALSGIEIAWNHVNGHVGIHGNEMADKLARKGCASYTPPNSK